MLIPHPLNQLSRKIKNKLKYPRSLEFVLQKTSVNLPYRQSNSLKIYTTFPRKWECHFTGQ